MTQDKQVISEDIVRQIIITLEELKQQSDNKLQIDIEMIQQLLLSQFGLNLNLN